LYIFNLNEQILLGTSRAEPRAKARDEQLSTETLSFRCNCERWRLVRGVVLIPGPCEANPKQGNFIRRTYEFFFVA